MRYAAVACSVSVLMQPQEGSNPEIRFLVLQNGDFLGCACLYFNACIFPILCHNVIL
jgi:hypothetical protein